MREGEALVAVEQLTLMTLRRVNESMRISVKKYAKTTKRDKSTRR